MRKYFFYGTLIFIFSILVGYMYSRIWHNENNREFTTKVINDISSNINEIENKNIENKVIETLNLEEKVLPTTKFAIKKNFKKCGHFSFNYTELPIEIINLNKEEVEEIYHDWKIEKFSKDEIVISKDIDELCDEHFIIKLDDGLVKIYNKTSDDNLRLYMDTEISEEYLTEDDIEKLKIGMLVYGRGRLNSVLEDFE